MSYIEESLEQLSARDELLPHDHVNYLYRLRDTFNFHPKVIYDIGSCVLHWTKHAHRVWPDAKIIAFDGLRWTRSVCEKYKEDVGVDKFDYHLDVLSHEDFVCVRWHESVQFPSGCSYYKEIGTDVYARSRGHPRMTRTLDSVVRLRDFPKPDLVKIDVQGAEVDILNGGVQTMSSTQHMLVELQAVEYNEGAWTVDKSMPFIESLGWTCETPTAFSRGHPDGDYHFSRP